MGFAECMDVLLIIVIIIDNLFNCQYPGPNEAGLAYQRQHTERYPLAERAWVGPAMPTSLMRHFKTVGSLLMTAGNMHAYIL